MTIRPMQQRRMKAIWIFACCYGPYVLAALGGLFFAMGSAS